jgi:hypothetical protein
MPEIAPFRLPPANARAAAIDALTLWRHTGSRAGAVRRVHGVFFYCASGSCRIPARFRGYRNERSVCASSPAGGSRAALSEL